MRIVLTSHGSTGDVQPIFAFAAELQRVGHTVSIVLPPRFRTRTLRLGFEFIGSVLDEVSEESVRRYAVALAEAVYPQNQLRLFVDSVVDSLPQTYKILLEACRDADVLISTPFQLAGRMVHDATGVRFVSLHLSPFGRHPSPTRREISAPPINACRVRLGLPTLDDPLGMDAESPELALYAVSRCMMHSRHSDSITANRHVTGFFYLHDDVDPDEALMTFLAAGDPPVAITFGSMMHEFPGGVTDLLLSALGNTGYRAVLQQGWSNLGQGEMPETIHTTGYVPHNWLFPRAACVVHHGGAGTTAAALRAGVPTIVVPHMLDQPMWAEYARAANCAGAVIPYAQLTPTKLADSLIRTIDDARYRAAAQRLARQIESEDGVSMARILVEQLVGL